MQGPSEFGVVGDVVLKEWDRKNDLKKLKIPVLTIGGEHDTMDPKQMEWMVMRVKMVLIFIVQMEAIGACMMIKKIILMVLQVL